MRRRAAFLLGVLFLLAAPRALSGEAPFSIHFIDVGQGDAALVMCEGETMLVDGGTTVHENEVCSYLASIGVGRIDYMICTHPHIDNIGQLDEVLDIFPVGAVLGSRAENDTGAFAEFRSALYRRGHEITTPEPGYEFALGGSRVTVLGPIRESSDINNMSLVLRVVYGETSFLLAADAKIEEENDILASGRVLASDVLKVSCQGSDDATSEAFLKSVNPKYAMISVGEDNRYGHPSDAMIRRLNAAGAEVCRTDTHGTIICSSDGQKLSITYRKDPEAREAAHSPEGEREYVLNVNSGKFHHPDCKNAKQMSEKNRKTHVVSRSKLIEQGYSPCGNCQP